MFFSSSLAIVCMNVPLMDLMGLTTIHLWVDKDADSRARHAVQMKKVRKVRIRLLLSIGDSLSYLTAG